MHYLLRRKIVTILVATILCPFIGKAQLRSQLNQLDHDEKLYHFGINLGFNQSHFQFTHHPQFLNPTINDSISVIESVNSVGINLAWLVNINLNKHFDIRTYPLNLTFSEKAFEYNLTKIDAPAGEAPLTLKKVQSITLSFPFLLKFSSDRIDNMKVYTILGGKFDYDLASTAGKKNADEMINLKAFDYAVEGGVGFHIYFPYFVLTPELKVSWGLSNLHSRNANLKYSSNIDKINARMISLSLTVE